MRINIVLFSTLAIMVKHDKLMMAHDCDFIKMVSDIKDRDGGEFPLPKPAKLFHRMGQLVHRS